MAEGLLRVALSGSGVSVHSAGLGALEGYPADETAARLMEERGIDISAHRARQLEAEMILTSDLVLVMESGHRQAALQIAPQARGKVFRLGEFSNIDIPDPYQMPVKFFESCLDKIDVGVQQWLERLKSA